MAHAFRRRHEHYVGRLDAEERGILASLMEQVLGLVAPDRSDTEVDEFEEMLRVGKHAIISFDNSAYWRWRMGNLFGQIMSEPLCDGGPRFRSAMRFGIPEDG